MKHGIAALLDSGVMSGHLALNPLRTVLQGEWYELLALQQEHGAEQLLIWQARAARRTQAAAFGVSPAYYRACATQAPHDITPVRLPVAERFGVHSLLAVSPKRQAEHLDPACDALLRELGVRERRQLAGVPYELVAAWRDALEHPGMAARFSAPLGFAVSQMRQANPPPSLAELESWAAREDRYESWRHIEPHECGAEAQGSDAALEARVRALAPPGADLAMLCELARLLEGGLPDWEALALLPPVVPRGAP